MANRDGVWYEGRERGREGEREGEGEREREGEGEREREGGREGEMSFMPTESLKTHNLTEGEVVK